MLDVQGNEIELVLADGLSRAGGLAVGDMIRQQKRMPRMTAAAVPASLSAAVSDVLAAAREFFGQENFDDAARLLRQVLAVAPRHAESLHMMALITHHAGRPAAARDLLLRALAVAPAEPWLHHSFGTLLSIEGRFEEAVTRFKRALRLNPDFAPSMQNLGNALLALRQIEQAILNFRCVLERHPDHADVRYSLALALLTQGNYAAGWREHESRWHTKLGRRGGRFDTLPQWHGEPAAGRTLLIYGEQGLGDTLQFCRYASLAADRGLHVILGVQPPLARLLSRMRGVETVLQMGGGPPPPFDLHSAMMSMPLVLGTTLDTIPSDVPYLHADPAQVATWRERLAAVQGLRVGVVWAGNPRQHDFEANAIDRRRSMPPALLAPLFEIPGIKFFSLQMGGAPAPAKFPLIDHMAEMNDFADTAALVEALDLVITVDTSMAHLVGALGKPVWVMDRFDSCWRWLTSRKDSPWYPTLRLYRQAAAGDWRPVVAEIAADLRALADRQLSLSSG